METLLKTIETPNLGGNQKIQIKLPISKGGFGIKSSKEVAPAARYAAVLQVIDELQLIKVEASENLQQELIDIVERLKQEVNMKELDLPVTLKEVQKSNGMIRGVQRTIMKQINKGHQQCLMNSETDEHKKLQLAARMKSLKMAAANVWLNTIPTDNSLQISDNAVVVASHLRLGIRQIKNLEDITHCRCGKSLERGIEHFFTCQYTRNRSLLQRHNNILNLIVKRSREAGCDTYVEPYNEEHTLRPDAKIRLTSQEQYIDVSFTHPTAESFEKQSATKGGFAANRRTEEKIKKYEAFDNFFPVVFETYGGIPNRTLTWIKDFTRETRTYNEYMGGASEATHFIRKLIAKIHENNAWIVKEGIRNCKKNIFLK